MAAVAAWKRSHGRGDDAQEPRASRQEKAQGQRLSEKVGEPPAFHQSGDCSHGMSCLVEYWVSYGRNF